MLEEKDVVVVPPKAETVVAPVMWITDMIIRCPKPQTEGSVTLNYIPMTADGVLVEHDADGNNTKRAVVVDNLYETMGECQELAAAFQAIIAAVLPIKAIIDKREADRLAKLEEERLAAEEASNPIEENNI